MKLFGVGKKDKQLEKNIKNDNSNFVEIASSLSSDGGQISLDIIENSFEFIIIAPIAGVKLDDIDISLKDGVLIISGNRAIPSELYSSDSTLRISEVFWGEFSRNVILPENLDLDQIKAILEKNNLIIRIPKLKFKGQNIEIEEIDS